MKYLTFLLILSAGCTKIAPDDQRQPGMVTTTCSNCITTVNNQQGPKIKVYYAPDTVLHIHVTDSARVRVFNRVNVQLWDTTLTRDSQFNFKFPKPII